MSGDVAGWLSWIAVTSLGMTVVCFLISLATRRFLSGPMLVLVTVLLMFLLTSIGLGSGMAQSDFKLGVLLPYTLLAAVIAAVWLLGMRAGLRGRKEISNS